MPKCLLDLASDNFSKNFDIWKKPDTRTFLHFGVVYIAEGNGILPRPQNRNKKNKNSAADSSSNKLIMEMITNPITVINFRNIKFSDRVRTPVSGGSVQIWVMGSTPPNFRKILNFSTL